MYDLKIQSASEGRKCSVALSQYNLEKDKSLKQFRLKVLMQMTIARWELVKAIDILSNTTHASKSSKSFIAQPHVKSVVDSCREIVATNP